MNVEDEIRGRWLSVQGNLKVLLNIIEEDKTIVEYYKAELDFELEWTQKIAIYEEAIYEVDKFILYFDAFRAMIANATTSVFDKIEESKARRRILFDWQLVVDNIIDLCDFDFYKTLMSRRKSLWRDSLMQEYLEDLEELEEKSKKFLALVPPAPQ